MNYVSMHHALFKNHDLWDCCKNYMDGHATQHVTLQWPNGNYSRHRRKQIQAGFLTNMA
jgi:hypothetical protein